MNGKILLDFRLSKGCGLEFKRRFITIKSMLNDIIVKGPVTWPIAAATRSMPQENSVEYFQSKIYFFIYENLILLLCKADQDIALFFEYQSSFDTSVGRGSETETSFRK